MKIKEIQNQVRTNDVHVNGIPRDHYHPTKQQARRDKRKAKQIGVQLRRNLEKLELKKEIDENTE
jgi:hypothetical protein